MPEPTTVVADPAVDGSTVPDPSQAQVALTPEQRDAQTIARLTGAPDSSGTPAPDDEKTPDEGAGAGKGEPGSGNAADPDSSTGEDDEPEVTDEDVDLIIEALDERLLNHPKIKKILEDRTATESQKRFEEQRKTAVAGQESERLINMGREAVTDLMGDISKLGEELAKAAKGDEFDGKIVIDAEKVKATLGKFSAAVTLVGRREYDDAFSEAVREAVPVGGSLTPEEFKSLQGIVSTAQRIESDPEQGSAKAKAHLFSETVKFLVKRAEVKGRTDALAEVESKRSALKKIVGDKGENATTAAMAKIAKQRKGLPPGAVPNEPTIQGGAPTMDAYRAAKAAGKHDEADAILEKMAAAKASGR